MLNQYDFRQTAPVIQQKPHGPIQPSVGSSIRSGASKTPLLVRLESNQVMNRLVIETLGYYAWMMAFSRNKWELLENVLDLAGWVAMGVFVPAHVIKRFRDTYVKHRVAPLKALPKVREAGVSILDIPFQFLEKHAGRQGYDYLPETAKLVEKLGFNSFTHLSETLAKNPKLLNRVRQGKLYILLIDLLCMACKGQFFNWGSKALTRKLSGEKGFSGTFNLTSKAYQNHKAEEFEQNKKKRFWLSLTMGFGGALLLPLVLLPAILKSPQAVGKGLAGKLKKTVLPLLNYTDGIYMSKWVILWHNIFNLTTPTLLSCRDKDEFREKLSKLIAFDSFCFVGDNAIMGLTATALQKKHRIGLKGASLLEGTKIGPLPLARRLSTAYELTKDSKSLFYRLSRNTFLTGLAGTTLCLGIATNLFNVLYTRKKATRDDRKFREAQGEHAAPVVSGNRRTLQETRFQDASSSSVDSFQKYKLAVGAAIKST